MKITAQWIEIDCRRVDEASNVWSVERNRDDEIKTVAAARAEIKAMKKSDSVPKIYRIIRCFEMSEVAQTIQP